MNVFKNIAGKIDEPAQIAKLQKIIDRRLEQYDHEIRDLINNQNRLYTAEEVAALEQQVIDNCLREYDEEAVPYMGHKCADNWREGGGELLEVRKRMLLRELESRRGRLAPAVTAKNNQINADLEEYVQFIHQQEALFDSQLPTSADAIVAYVAQTKVLLSNVLAPKYPQGYDYFNNFVNNALFHNLDGVQSRLIHKNRCTHHDLDVQALVKSISRLHTTEEAEQLEQQLVDQTLQKFDADTVVAPVPPGRREWVVDFAASRRGQVTNAINDTNARIQGHLAEYQSQVAVAEEQIRAQLPRAAAFVNEQWDVSKQNLNNSILANYPDGYDHFNSIANNQLQSSFDAAKERISADNDRLTQEAISAFKSQKLADITESFRVQLQQLAGQAKDSLNDNASDVITGDVLDAVRGDIDALLQRAIGSL